MKEITNPNISERSVTTHIHMCVDIAGVLKWPDSHLRKLFREDDGSQKSGKYVRDWLRLQLHQGKRVLPMSKECEGFSFQTGCPGHPQTNQERPMSGDK